MAKAENIIGPRGGELFFKVTPPEGAEIGDPKLSGDALRTVVQSLAGFQKEAVVTSARTGASWYLVSDEGAYLDGHDEAPCPLAFFTTGMAASYTNEIVALLKRNGATVRNLVVTLDTYFTMRGSMQKRTMVGGALPAELVVEINCNLDDAALRALLSDAVAATPLTGLVRDAVPSLFALARNGTELTPERVTRLEGDLMPEVKLEGIEKSAKNNPFPLVEKIGPSPVKKLAKATSAASSSLADEQDRVLNLGSIVTLREDGIKDIETRIYSPHGTAFRFLSEEAEINGGQGRAPDANTFISAGIGFCFMTQFGRFVSMLKLDLPHYSIVQDTRFSLGGASGDTGTAGTADPIETHVHLQTSESDATAREMLDISEMTCFLHAMCRSELKTRISLIRS